MAFVYLNRGNKQFDVDTRVILHAEINLFTFFYYGTLTLAFHRGCCLLLQRLCRSFLLTRHRSAPAVREGQTDQIIRAPTPFLEACSGRIENKINDCFFNCLMPSTEPHEDQTHLMKYIALKRAKSLPTSRLSAP